MNFRKFSVFIALFLLGFNTVHGSSPTNVRQFINHSAWNFVENKGQLPSSEIKYYGRQGGVYLYCKPRMIEFVFTKVEKESEQISEATSQPAGFPLPKGAGGFGREKSQQSKIKTSRADLILLNSNPSAQIIASDKQEYYENYYTENTGENGITNVHTYKTITYKSIYPNIDLVLYARANGMKYEFVVYPGGKVSDIQIDWRGIESIKKLKNSGIEYSCSLRKMDESAPYSFVRADPCVRPIALNSDKGRTHGSAPYEEIKSHFILKNNHISFKNGKYNKTKTLVIDPTLEWGTYFGGNVSYGSRGIATDVSGNVYITGGTESTSGISTTGAFQASFGGNADAFLTKFDQNGSLLWSTYYGGAGIDYGNSVALDINGNVFISGGTTSPSDIATSGAYQTLFSNLYQHNAINNPAFSVGFIAKFAGNGYRLWGTYLWNDPYGGSNVEGNTISSDKSGNIYIAGTTTSQTGIATSGAFQPLWTLGSPTNGVAEGYLAKFSSSGTIQWATYFAGNSPASSNGPAYVDCQGISIDDSEYVYISGATNCSSGIATNGAYQTSLAGYDDAFIAKFNSYGSRIWATYFGGKGEEDWSDIAVGNGVNIYITGHTTSSSGIATADAFQTYYYGSTSINQSHYLAKFSNTGSLAWATYYTDSNNFEISKVAADHTDNVYITGATFKDDHIVTSGTYQTSFGGSVDVFLAKFDATGVRLWGTYYGGSGSDESYGIATDRAGHVYITGFTNSSSQIATMRSYKTSLPNNTTSVFLAKFGTYQYDAGVASIPSQKDTICIGSQPVLAKFKNFGIRELDSVHIGWSVNGKTQTSIKWSGKLLSDSFSTLKLGNYNFQPGIDTIKAWTSNPNGVLDSFPENDTAISIVYVSPLPTATAGPDTTLCYNETYTMQGAGGITYLWTPAKYLSNDTIATPKAVLPNSQLYTLYVSNKYGCEDSANVLLTVKPRLQVKIGTVISPVCAGSNVSLSAVGSGGDSTHYAFSWQNDSLKGNSVNLKINQSGWHGVILSDNCSGSPGKDSVFIEVTPRPKADFTILNRHPYLPDTSFRFQNLSTNATTYLWTFGDSSPSNTATDPVHIYTDSGTYKISLIAYGKCTNDTFYGYIHIFEKYINIYIPDAFSPNGDGVNDVFDIKGLGFGDYNITIYNQWGELLFSSPLERPGEAAWDGSFKNQPAPEGIYVYMISVTDQFGIKHYFSGNLTLMR